MDTKQSHTINIFIAYSRKDIECLQRIKTHLRPLQRKHKNLNIWYDGEIIAGEKWDEKIKEHIYKDDIIIALISADSLASDYFYEEEIKHALKRHNKNEAIAIPVIVRTCSWKDTSLADLQALPKNGKPISQWNDQSQAYADIYNGIKTNIQIAIKRKGGFIAKHLDNAHKALNEKNFTKAKKYIEEVFKINPNHAEAKNLLENIKQVEQTQKEINQHLGNAHKALDAKDFKRTKKHIEEVFKIDPNHTEASNILANINKTLLTQKKEEEVGQHIKNAHQALKNKKFRLAKTYARSALKLNPNNKEAKNIIRQYKQEQKKGLLKELKNPLAIATILAILINIFLAYKMLEVHQELQTKCTGNCRNEFGTFDYGNGRVYTGRWKNGKFNGQGTFYFENGQRYKGSWINNKRDGKGTLYYKNDTIYNGDWKDDRQYRYESQ